MQQQGSPSRVNVERGIYKRRTRDGLVYEAIYQDSNGKTRWSTHATLKDARAARAEKVAALARGERIAPSKVTLPEYAERGSTRRLSSGLARATGTASRSASTSFRGSAA